MCLAHAIIHAWGKKFLHFALWLCWKKARALKFSHQKAESVSCIFSAGTSSDLVAVSYPAWLFPHPPARSVMSAAPAPTAASVSRFSACGLLLGTAVPYDAAGADALPAPTPSHTDDTSTHCNHCKNKAKSIKAESFSKPEITAGF